MIQALAAVGIVVAFFLLVAMFGVPSHFVRRTDYDAMRRRAVEYDRLHGRGRADS